MRLLLILAALALAAPAAAQQGRIGEAPQGDADLRGTVGPAAPLPFAPQPIVLADPLYSPAPDPDQARQCRLACAQDYYFCLAQDEQSECSPGWRACFLSCGV